MKTKLLLITLFILLSTNTITAQNFNIVSEEIKSERKAIANKNAYIAKVNNAWAIAKQKNTIDSYEQFLSKNYNSKTFNKKALNSVFNLVSEVNTIKAYESFIAKKYASYKLKKQAIANIYFITTKEDALKGYKDFLKNHPKSPDAEKATNRIYEIMYAISEEENSIHSYYGFLKQFPKSQIELRDKAYINMQMLEVEKTLDNYNQQKTKQNTFELKERIARQLYIEAIRAKDAGDNYTFMRKYNTVLYSELFKDTKTAFDLFRDKELATLIKGLVNEVRQLKYSIRNMQRDLTNKLDRLENNFSSLRSEVMSSQNDYSNYLDRISTISNTQSNSNSSCYSCSGSNMVECYSCGGDGLSGFWGNTKCTSCVNGFQQCYH